MQNFLVSMPLKRDVQRNLDGNRDQKANLVSDFLNVNFGELQMLVTYRSKVLRIFCLHEADQL